MTEQTVMFSYRVGSRTEDKGIMNSVEVDALGFRDNPDMKISPPGFLRTSATEHVRTYLHNGGANTTIRRDREFGVRVSITGSWTAVLNVTPCFDGLDKQEYNLSMLGRTIVPASSNEVAA